MALDREAPFFTEYVDWKKRNDLIRKGDELLARARRLAQRLDERVRELTEYKKVVAE